MIALMFQPTIFAQKRTGKKGVPSQKAVTVKQKWDFSTIDNLLPLYVKAKNENKDFNSPLTGILVFYGGLSDMGKLECRKYLVDKMDGYYNDQKPTEALAVADIYEPVAPINDFGRLRVYYYRGEQAATVQGDTTQLKQYIDAILSLPDAGNDKKQDCLSVLNGYLEEIRNYVPVDKTIDGVWVSNIQKLYDKSPFFVLRIHTGHDGNTTFTLSDVSAYLSYAYSSDASKQIAQEEFAFDSDSIFAVWSNEDLKKPSAELNYMFRQTAGAFSSALGAKAAMGGNAITGSLTSGIVDLGMNALADAIFTPSKRAYLLQMKMRKINDRQIEADIFSTKLKVKGDNQPKVTEDKWHALFSKVEPEDSIFWADDLVNLISVFESSEELTAELATEIQNELAKYLTEEYKNLPKTVQQQVIKELSDEKIRKTLPEELRNKLPQRLSKEEKKNIKKRYGLSSMSDPKKIKAYNNLQFDKMHYINEAKLIRQGITVFSNIVNIHNSRITPFIGVICNENNTTVSKIVKYSPADFAELKKGDIITHVDGYEIKTFQQFVRMIKRKKPFDKVTLTIKRKKETMTIPLELYFYKG